MALWTAGMGVQPTCFLGPAMSHQDLCWSYRYASFKNPDSSSHQDASWSHQVASWNYPDASRSRHARPRMSQVRHFMHAQAKCQSNMHYLACNTLGCAVVMCVCVSSKLAWVSGKVAGRAPLSSCAWNLAIYIYYLNVSLEICPKKIGIDTGSMRFDGECWCKPRAMQVHWFMYDACEEQIYKIVIRSTWYRTLK